MSPEERQLLTSLFDRVETASTTPRDPQAEQLIDEQTRRQPYATYYLAQAVIVQEKGLEAAAQRIQELEARVRELETAAAHGTGSQAGNQPGNQNANQGGGFLSSIFGSSEQPRTSRPSQTPVSGQISGQGAAPTGGVSGPWGDAARVPQPSSQAYGGNRGYYDDGRAAPMQQPSGPWGGQSYGAPSAGGSFLRGALGTAAGVAGGMLLANSLSGIFGSHTAGLGWGSPAQEAGTAPVEETTINNYYGNSTDAGDSQLADAGDTAPDSQDAGFQQADYGNDDADFGSDDFGGDDNLDV